MVLSEVDVLNAKYFALSTLRVSTIKIPTLSRRRRRSIDPELNFCICEFQRHALCLVQLRIQVFCREAPFLFCSTFFDGSLHSPNWPGNENGGFPLKTGNCHLRKCFWYSLPEGIPKVYTSVNGQSMLYSILESQIEGATNLLGVTGHSKEAISHPSEPPITVYNHSRMVDRRSWDFFAFEHLRAFWKNRLEQEWNLWISHGYTLLRFGVGRSCS